MDSATWKQRIVEMAYIKSEIYRLDRKGKWEYHFPAVAATVAEVLAAEQILGESLPPHYRTFLLHANGWRSFWQSADLFGTHQLLGGPERESAAALLGYLDDEGVLADLGLRVGELLPVAAKRDDLDLFVIGRQSSPIPGVVIWFAGDEIDRYPDFDEYFLAMMAYNHRRLQIMQQEA